MIPVVTTGPRDCRQSDIISASLLLLSVTLGPDLLVIQGGARGADRWVEQACVSLGISHETEDADWTGPCDIEGGWCQPGHRRARWDGYEYCPRAGHRRNQLMLDKWQPRLLTAFIDPEVRSMRGTEDMIARAEDFGCVVARIDVAESLAAAGAELDRVMQLLAA